jgi:pSer/pThr/pTyr-binding forkhead associated (FHA) protein
MPVSGIVCGNCGHRNPPSANFCSSCGAALRDVRDARTDTMHIEAIPDIGDEYDVDRSQFAADTGLLVVTRGAIAGSRFVLDAPRTTLGRHPDSDIFLDDVTVSRRHAEVRRDDSGNYVARDVGSLNGTYLNRTRVDEAELRDGDELQIGMFKLVFFHGTKR